MEHSKPIMRRVAKRERSLDRLSKFKTHPVTNLAEWLNPSMITATNVVS